MGEGDDIRVAGSVGEMWQRDNKTEKKKMKMMMMGEEEDEKKQHRVLFICLGNICRSPLAQALAQHIAPSTYFESAGTAAYHTNKPPDKRTLQICRNHGVQIEHKARQIQKRDWNEYDWIVCMDQQNVENCMGIKPKDATAKSNNSTLEYQTSRLNADLYSCIARRLGPSRC